MILLIDNYDSFTFNLYQYLEELGYACRVVRNDEITSQKISKLSPAAIVISPGPGKPSAAGICPEVIRKFSGVIPILGVCLGHQAIGEGFGGAVVKAKRMMHGKTSLVYHHGEGLYAGLPNPFPATRYHSLIIERNSMPKCLELTAETSDGVVMGVRHKKFQVEGVQFHPESVMTNHGKKLLQNFLEAA